MATFFSKEEGKTYECLEGTITRTKGVYSLLNGAKIDVISFASPIGPETFLKHGSAALSVQAVAEHTGTGDNAVYDTATHITMYEPEWGQGEIPRPTGSNATISQGNYTNRAVTAFELKTGEMMLPLSASNSAISVGDPLEVDADTMGLEKGGAGSTSKCTALEAKAANKGGYILVDMREPSIPVL